MRSLPVKMPNKSKHRTQRIIARKLKTQGTIPGFSNRVQLLLVLQHLSQLFLQKQNLSVDSSDEWVVQEMCDGRSLFKILNETPVCKNQTLAPSTTQILCCPGLVGGRGQKVHTEHLISSLSQFSLWIHTQQTGTIIICQLN